MKKMSKLLAAVAVIGAVAGAAYYVIKKVREMDTKDFVEDEDFADEDDFVEDDGIQIPMPEKEETPVSVTPVSAEDVVAE